MIPDQTNSEKPPQIANNTRILIDLSKELTPEELAAFKQAAADAGAPTLTDHFLNLTLRIPTQHGIPATAG